MVEERQMGQSLKMKDNVALEDDDFPFQFEVFFKISSF